MTDHIKGAIIAVLVLLVLGAAAVGGYFLGKPHTITETAKPEVIQSDGSHIAEVKPDAKAKPKQMIPKGSKVERTGEITVLGAGVTVSGQFKSCPAVTIDTTLVRNGDGSRRVIVSSPDGTITRAIDIPVEAAAPPPEPKKWAAGMSYDPIHQTPGVWIERDLWRVRLGAELNKTRLVVAGPTGTELRLRVGVTF